MYHSISSLLTALIGMYGLRLALSGKLIYYIHPRYTAFTIGTCIFLVAVGTISYAVVYKGAQTDKRWMRSTFQLSPIFLLVIVGMLFPAKPLTSAAAVQRAGTFPQPQTAEVDDGTGDVMDVREVDTQEWAFEDWWYSLIVQDRNVDHYVGKHVTVVGFVSRPETSPPGTFYLTRFLLMCCAIDAQPVGFWVRESGDDAFATTSLASDEWVEVSGMFEVVDVNEKKTLMVQPESINPTEQPEDPYVY